MWMPLQRLLCRLVLLKDTSDSPIRRSQLLAANIEAVLDEQYICFQ